jgi:glycosyltransferase involved in cell wall biosynthesis
MISVLILTLNEEANVANCIGSLPDAWRGDVWVLDSGSDDRTCELSEAAGAKVVVHSFAGYASQRNFGLSQAFLYDWILMLDADERMTPELAQEIETKLSDSGGQASLYRMRRKDMFMGRWLRRSSGYPTWFPRLFRKGTVRVEREINEAYVTNGSTCQLKGHLLHYPFNKGIDWWFERHNEYSAVEAQLLQERRDRVRGGTFRDPSQRRAALKAIAYRLPLRPYLVFLYLYVVRGGFLDGRPGWVYVNMRLAYEIMIDAKAAFISHSIQAPRDTHSKVVG